MASQRSNLLPLVAFLGLFVCACSQPASDKTTPAGQALIGSYNIAGCTPGGEGCGGGIQALIDFGADFTEMVDYDGMFEIVEEAAPGLLLVRWTYPGDPAPFVDEGVYNLIPCDLTQAPKKPYDKMCLTGAWAAQSYPDECGTETTPACEHNTTTASSFWGTQFAAIFLDADERPILKSSWAEVSQNMGENPTGTGMEVAVHESLSVTDCDCL